MTAVTGSTMADIEDALAAIDGYVESLGEAGRRVTSGEWGVTVEVEGWPLHVGLRLAGGLLGAQAMAVGPGRLEEWGLLRANRPPGLVAFGLSASGEVWVRGVLPVAGASAVEVDRLLVEAVQAAGWARRQSGR